jgi:hypothetical protein
MGLTLKKIDVARRQLVTAIRLFFDGGDPVSIYSLAANSWEVIDALCVSTGVQSLSQQTRTHIASGKDLKSNYINSPYRNFFKHADRDPDAVLDSFQDRDVDSIIFLATEDYIRFLGKSPVELQVFQLWYLGCNTAMVATNNMASVLDACNVLFPKLEYLERGQQIAAGWEALERARADIELIQDPKTELPD